LPRPIFVLAVPALFKSDKLEALANFPEIFVVLVPIAVLSSAVMI